MRQEMSLPLLEQALAASQMVLAYLRNLTDLKIVLWTLVEISM